MFEFYLLPLYVVDECNAASSAEIVPMREAIISSGMMQTMIAKVLTKTVINVIKMAQNKKIRVNIFATTERL